MSKSPSFPELHSADPRQNIFYQDLAIEPAHTNEEKEMNRIEKLRNMKHLSYLE